MIDNKYKELKDLSSGSYGKVWMWEIVSDSDSDKDAKDVKKAAVKVYMKSSGHRGSKMAEQNNKNDGAIRHFKAECEALTKLKHPYIVKLLEYKDIGIRIDEVNNVEQVRYAALELAQNGNLLDYVADRHMKDNIVRFYFKQLLQAVDFMHSRGMWHRDLKLENILLDSEYNLKVTDFGFATSLRGSNADNKLYDCKGTLRYMAPEIFKGTGYLGRSVDIFALGVILFSMKTGRPPFMQMASLQDSLYYLIQSHQFEIYWMLWENFANQSGFTLSDAFKDLFVALVWYYPTSRLSLNELYMNDWMRGPVPDKNEVKSYMINLQREMELSEQEQFNKQESAASNYITNVKNDDNFEVQDGEEHYKVSPEKDYIAEHQDKGKIMYSDIENEPDLDDDFEFGLGDDNMKFDIGQDSADREEFTGYQEIYDNSDNNQEDIENTQHINEGKEEIDTNIFTVYPDKIWEYLMEYAKINKFNAWFDEDTFTLNFEIPNDSQLSYFGMKFIFAGWEKVDSSKSRTRQPKNNYKIFFLRKLDMDDEDFKSIGLHILDQISNYI